MIIKTTISIPSRTASLWLVVKQARRLWWKRTDRACFLSWLRTRRLPSWTARILQRHYWQTVAVMVMEAHISLMHLQTSLICKRANLINTKWWIRRSPRCSLQLTLLKGKSAILQMVPRKGTEALLERISLPGRLTSRSHSLSSMRCRTRLDPSLA